MVLRGGSAHETASDFSLGAPGRAARQRPACPAQRRRCDVRTRSSERPGRGDPQAALGGALRGTVVQKGPLVAVKLPNMLIALTKKEPTGGSEGTVMDHFYIELTEG